MSGFAGRICKWGSLVRKHTQTQYSLRPGPLCTFRSLSFTTPCSSYLILQHAIAEVKLQMTNPHPYRSYCQLSDQGRNNNIITDRSLINGLDVYLMQTCITFHQKMTKAEVSASKKVIPGEIHTHQTNLDFLLSKMYYVLL